MINPKSKRRVKSGVSGATGETVVISPDSGQIFSVVVGVAATSGDTANIDIYDTNDATLVDASGSGNLVARIDGHYTGTYKIKAALHTGLTYKVSGDYAAGGSPDFTIVYE